MKKLLILLVSVAFTSCKCVLSQVPPQVIYADADCQAQLPNYLEQVVASDNCELFAVTQTPEPGYVLDAQNQVVNVTIRAQDVFNNSTEVTFSVTLLDTIPPVLEWPIGQINMTEDDVRNLYTNWVAAVKVHGIARWMYDRTWTQGLPLADTTFVDSCGVTHDYHVEDNLKYFHNIIKLSDEEFDQYVTLVETNK
jgi:hypothetical protein